MVIKWWWLLNERSSEQLLRIAVKGIYNWISDESQMKLLLDKLPRCEIEENIFVAEWNNCKHDNCYVLMNFAAQHAFNSNKMVHSCIITAMEVIYDFQSILKNLRQYLEYKLYEMWFSPNFVNFHFYKHPTSSNVFPEWISVREIKNANISAIIYMT